MDSTSIVRIVVLQPGTPPSTAPAGSAAEVAEAAQGPSHADTLVALGRIGAEVELDVTIDMAGCARAAARHEIDLVVLDRCDPLSQSEVFTTLESLAAPVIVVIDRAASEEIALEAFRAGAADCVRAGSDYLEVLPVVALEQIRRWRQQRERSRAQHRIESLERLQQAIVSEIPVSLVVVDPDGSVVDANPEFERAFGMSAKHAVGAPLEDVLPEELLRTGGLLDLHAHAAGPGEWAPRLARCHDSTGALRAFDVRCRRLGEGDQRLLALSDVSENEMLAQKLSELQRYNEKLVENINSALLVLDAQGCITYANPTACEILGGSEQSLAGRAIWDWFGQGEVDGEQLRSTLADGTRYKGAETMISLEDGTVLPIGVSCTPLREDDGTISGLVAIFQDLSEIKQLQRQVLQTEKMASIGQLAAGVAHEINNPMGFIHANLQQMNEYLQDLSGYWQAVDTLKESVVAGDPEKSAAAAAALSELAAEVDLDFVRRDFGKAVRESQEGSERIRHIVKDLRDFSHQGSAERTLADVNQCVDTTASIVWTMMKHIVVLEKDYADLPQINCYPMQLKQVFMNLLVNACQAVQEVVGSGGDIGVIKIVTRSENDGVRVTISDTGVGVSKENLARIFDPFFTTKEVGSGTGLGLSTSYGIVQAHGGQMTVESVPGEGSNFSVWLPLAPPPDASDANGVG